MRRLIFFTILLAWWSSGTAQGAVIANYDAGVTGVAPDPATATGGAWTAGLPTSDTSNFQSGGVSPDGATGYNAWRMADNSTAASQFLTWTKSFSAQQQLDAAANGWRLSARLRVVDPVAGYAGTTTVVLIYGNNASKRWLLFLDVNASGVLVATLTGGATVTLTGVSATAQNLHELVYNPATGTAEYLVNGVSKATGYAGTSGTFNGVQWGTGSSGGRGEGYWNQVVFTIADPPQPTAPPVLTGQTSSQSVAAGGSATFSGTFTGAASYQWYKNTVPVAGATAATLTLSNLAPADAGEYWLRATNALGSRETATAALVVLTAGASLELSEVVARNDGGLRDADATRQDWLEIHNPSTAAVSTAGWRLTDDAALPGKWTLPAQSIPAGGFLVVFASGKDRAVAGAELHTNFKISAAAGGYLALIRPGGTVATAFTCPQQYADISYGLTSTGAVKYFRIPTPGAPNVDGLTAPAPGPALTPPGGTFSGTLGVTAASALTGGTLRVTTDGQLPTFDSPAYTAPLALSATASVRAAVLYPGERYGAVATAGYLRIGANLSGFTSPLPIVVLHNLGAGAVPGVSSYGSYNDGSGVVEVANQPVALTILDGAAGSNTLSSPIVTTTRAGIRLRGSSSFSFPRKTYTLETWGELDGVGVDQTLLGLPADNDWVLYGPDSSEYDAPLIHNSFIYAIARAAGYNAPRTKFVELFLNTAGGDLTAANSLGLYLLVEKPKRAKDRVDFDVLNADGTAGGWMVNINRMDSLPTGGTSGSAAPRHFHTAGADGILQTEDDNVRGYQGPSGGSGLAPPRDDQPSYYHSFFNFDSPGGWDITTAQRAPIESQLRALDTALYSSSYTSATTGYAAWLDVPNWAQHLALQCFAKNQDGVVLSAYLYRETPASKIRFGPLWDFDRSFNHNPTNGSATDSPTWAHDRLYYPRLLSDPEFLQAYIDQWQSMRRGALSTAKMQAVVDAQAAEITSAVAARSGLTASAWTANLATLRQWVADRGAAMDALYTQPATFSQNGGSVPAGYALTMAAPAGSVYYTTNGTDPRAVGGGMASGAKLYQQAVPISAATTVFARVKNGTAWSGTTIATFAPPQDPGTLRVTEIMYNPPDQASPAVSGSEFEFIELQNTGAVTLDLGGLAFTSGITFTFPAGTTLASGAFFLLARNATQFAARYPGAAIGGLYTGKLSNSGDTLTLARGTETVWTFTYGIAPPWPTPANGGGMSLQRANPTAPGYDAATWTAAAPTPGRALSLADSDSNGLPDYWEKLYALSNPGGDADGDGATNLAEYLAGTDPRDPASVLRLSIAPVSAGLQLAFPALAGRSYTIQSSTDLVTWSKLIDYPATGVTRTQAVTVSGSTGVSFFRLLIPATGP